MTRHVSAPFPAHAPGRRAGCRWRLACVLAGCLLTAGPGRAAVVNGLFDAGLDGWETEGALFTTGAQGVITDQTSRRAMLWQLVTLEPGAYVLSFDVLATLARVGADGTLPDVFFASIYIAPDPLAFDPVGLTGFDTALPVLDMDYRGVTALGPGALTLPSPKGAGYLRVTMPFALTAGVAVPLFEVNDLNFIPSDSVAAVDNVSIALVPEPTAAALILPVAIMACRRRRRMA